MSVSVSSFETKASKSQTSKVSVSVSHFETSIQKSQSQNTWNGLAHHWIFESQFNWLSIAHMIKMQTKKVFLGKILKYQNANYIDFHWLTCNLYIFATFSFSAKVVRFGPCLFIFWHIKWWNYRVYLRFKLQVWKKSYYYYNPKYSYNNGVCDSVYVCVYVYAWLLILSQSHHKPYSSEA